MKMTRLVLLLCLAASPALQAQSDMPQQPTSIPNEVLVKFVPAADATQQALINAELGAEVLSTIPELGVLRVQSLVGDSTPALIAKYTANPFVAYAEPNSLYYFALTPNDPKFTCQWGLYNG